MIQYFMCLTPIGPVKFMVFFLFPLRNISLVSLNCVAAQECNAENFISYWIRTV